MIDTILSSCVVSLLAYNTGSELSDEKIKVKMQYSLTETDQVTICGLHLCKK